MFLPNKHKKLIEQGNNFLGKGLTKDDNKFKAWHSAVIKFVNRIYKEQPEYVEEFKNVTFDNFDDGVQSIVEGLKQMDFDVAEYMWNNVLKAAKGLGTFLCDFVKSIKIIGLK